MKTSLLCSILLVGLLVSAPVSAAELDFIEPSDRVSASFNTTYLDLALQFAPGLNTTPADGSDLAKLPHLGGREMSATIAKPAIRSIERLDIMRNGTPALLLLFDLGSADDAAQTVTVLALYDMASAPRLVDAMDVGLDRETSFQEPRYEALSPEIGMIFLRNSHHNAGEEYLQTSLIGLWKGKLHEVDTVFSMSWNANDRRISTTFVFTPVKNAAAFDAAVEIKKIQCEDYCDPDSEGLTKIEYLQVRYQWDAASNTFLRPKEAYDRIPLPDMQE